MIAMSDEQRYHIGVDDKPHKCLARTTDSCPLKKVGTFHGTLKEVENAIEDKARLANMNMGGLSKSTSRTTAATTPAQSNDERTAWIQSYMALVASSEPNDESTDVNAAASPTLSKSASPTSGAGVSPKTAGSSAPASTFKPLKPRRLVIPEEQKLEYDGLRTNARNTVEEVMASGSNIHSILSESYGSLEDAVGVPRGEMIGDSKRPGIDLKHSNQFRLSSWPYGKLSPDDLYLNSRTSSTRSSAVIVLNARLESMVRDGWTSPDKSTIDAEQNRIWQSLPTASRRSLRKSDVRGLAIVQAGYEPGSDSKIGDPSDPASLTQQTLSYARRARGMEEDGTPLSGSASRDALDLMQITAKPWDDESRRLLKEAGETRYQYNLRPDGVALWRVAMVQNAMADGRDLSDNEQWRRDVAEPEALMGMTGTMMSKYGGKLPQEARAWLGTNPDWQIRPTRMVN